ncbi:MAG: ABC transporter ATP-binding protein [Desulfobacter sp.]|nr:MAG: ABC transporter ATP-binding protein [Desulfobacter sp.]
MILSLKEFACGYGNMQVVSPLTLDIEKGSVTAILGANGAGKSSLIMALAGQVAVKNGQIIYDGREITHASPMERVKTGIAICPEGRRLFQSLTVRENLVVGGYTTAKAQSQANMDRVVSIFPRLGERMDQKAGSLSGGEQQMLAIGRALMAEPRLLMIDELSLGLMPKAVDICYEAILSLNKEGLTILLVEQSTQRALDAAQGIAVLESGNLVWQGTSREARQSSEMIDAILGLHG